MADELLQSCNPAKSQIQLHIRESMVELQVSVFREGDQVLHMSVINIVQILNGSTQRLL